MYSRHGLYIGYAWSFGKLFITQTSDDPQTLRHKAYLWDSGWFAVPHGKILKIPAVFSEPPGRCGRRHQPHEELVLELQDSGHPARQSG